MKSKGLETRTYHFKVDVSDSTEEAEGKIVGYGSIFGSRSEDLGGFVEIIAPGAFDGVLEDDVRALFNHDPNFVLGRNKSGTLALTVDERGLRYEIDPPKTGLVNDMVIEPMRRGDINQSSFAFVVGDDEWAYDEKSDTVVRTVKSFSALRDVSVVTYPAYSSADSSVRSAEKVKEARNTGDADHSAETEKRERTLQMMGN